MPAGVSAPGFRRDVQGLRGVAVLLVVAFHAGWAMPGGYVGVDVFFVISGFVIGRRLVVELAETGTLDLREFYARRARRLLPALAVCTLVTILLSVLLLNPEGPLRFAAGTAVAASLFGANYYLARSGSGYFDPGDEANPLLHTWSLSVEEQFYFVLPIGLMLIVGWTARRRLSAGPTLRVVIVVAVLVSLALSVSLVDPLTPQVEQTASDRFAFYGAPTRVWQFGVGVLLALRHAWPNFRPALAGAAGGVGLLLILVASLRFDGTTPFPGIAAAVPVAGVVLLIAAGGSASWVQRALEASWLVRIGDLSYSWYLWHWPLIVFASVLWPGSAGPVSAAAVLSLIPAWASFRFLEERWRRRHDLAGWRAVRLAAVCIVVPAGVGAVVWLAAVEGAVLETPAELRQETMATRQGCTDEFEEPIEWDPTCHFAVSLHEDGPILLVGDSHADVLSDPVADVADSLEVGFAIWTRQSTPVVGDGSGEETPATSWTEAVLELVDELEPALVIVSNRSPLYIESVGRHSAWSSRTLPDRQVALRAWTNAVRELGQEMARRETPMLWVSVVPEFAHDPVSTRSIARRRGVPPTLTLEEVEGRRGAIVERERLALAEIEGAAVFDPVPALCPRVCRSQSDGVWLYRDDNHLTPAGTRPLVGPLEQAVREVLGDAAADL